MKKPPGRKAKLAAVARESERVLLELIRRWQALPPGRRTHFLRRRIGFAGLHCEFRAVCRARASNGTPLTFDS